MLGTPRTLLGRKLAIGVYLALESVEESLTGRTGAGASVSRARPRDFRRDPCSAVLSHGPSPPDRFRCHGGLHCSRSASARTWLFASLRADTREPCTCTLHSGLRTVTRPPASNRGRSGPPSHRPPAALAGIDPSATHPGRADDLADGDSPRAGLWQAQPRECLSGSAYLHRLFFQSAFGVLVFRLVPVKRRRGGGRRDTTAWVE